MSQFFSYWSTIAQYTNPFSILWSGILLSILAFLFLIVVIILFRKQILVKRRHWVLRFLAITYMILLPFFAAYFGFKWGILHGLQKDITVHLPVYTKDLDHIFRSSLENEIAGMPQLSVNEYIDWFSEIVYNEYYTTIMEQVSGEGITGIIALRIHSVFHDSSVISRYAKRKIHQFVADKLGLNQGITREIMAVKVNELLQDGLFNKIVSIYIKRTFNSLKNGVLLAFIMILAFPIAEIGISLWLHRSGVRSEQLNSVKEE